MARGEFPPMHFVFQFSLVNDLIGWERSLGFKEERRKNHRFEAYVNYLAALQARRNDNGRKPGRNLKKTENRHLTYLSLSKFV
jgi:hypothetical protein